MNRVLLKSLLQLELKNNETDRHLGWYKIGEIKSLFYAQIHTKKTKYILYVLN